MNRRDFREGGRRGAGGRAVAAPAAAGAQLDTKIVRLNLQHTWTTTMSSSAVPRHPARALHARRHHRATAKARPSCAITRMPNGAQKAVESVRGPAALRRSDAVRQDHGRGLPARAGRMGRQGGHRYRADGLGGAEAGHPALHAISDSTPRTRRSPRFPSASTRPRSPGRRRGKRPISRPESESRARHRRAHHRSRAQRHQQAAARGRQRGLEGQRRGRPQNQLAGEAGRGVHRAAHAGRNDRGDALGAQPRAHPDHRRRGLPARRRHPQAARTPSTAST